MNAISKWAMALLTPMCFAQGVAAQQCTTLVYTGTPITFPTVYSSNGNNLPPLTLTNPPIVGIVVLNGPLASGTAQSGQQQTVTPVAFDFSATDSRVSWPDGDAIPGFPYYPHYENPTPSFSFTVNAIGVITEWNIVIDWNTGAPGTNTNILINSTDSGDNLGLSSSGVGQMGYPQPITGSSSAPGVWSCLTDLFAQVTTLTSHDATLTAQAAALQAQVAALTTQVASLTAQRNTYLSGYLQENADIIALNGELGALINGYDYWSNQARALTIQINALNAEIAKLEK
jgi:hypothetical protein